MNKTVLNIKASIAVIFFTAMLFSCQSRIDEVRQMDLKTFNPTTEETQVNAIYTDSGKTTLRLMSPLILDYSNQEFPFRESPESIHVELYGKKDEKTVITADYAIMYNTANLMDLRGNVKILMADSTQLTAEQLYWDQEEAWVFTDQPYRLKLNNGTTNEGEGFDSDENFNNFSSRSNIGVHYIEEDKK